MIRAGHISYFLPTVDVLVDEQNFFDQPVKNDLKTYNNIKKASTDQGDHYTTDFLLDYPYFENTVR